MRFGVGTGPVPLLGIEAETLGWHNGKKDFDVVAELDKLGLMRKKSYVNQHKYHCGCHSCGVIGSTPIIPPQFKMQYDASLPKEGAEFISSPFPALIPVMETVVQGLVTIGDGSRGPDEGIIDIKGRPASAGMHIHASVKLSDWQTEKGILKDAIRTFYLYYPEIFALASSTGRRRFVHYRFPRYTHHDRHSFLIQSNGHLEWRVFEADLSDENYLLGSMIVAACLTYTIKEPRVLSMLEGIGHLDRWDVELMDDMYQKSPADFLPEGSPIPLEYDNKVREIVASNFNSRRMEALCSVLQDLTFDSDVSDRLDVYLERAWNSAS